MSSPIVHPKTDVVVVGLGVAGGIAATELATNGLSWLKFRREASYHSSLARIFGLLLFIAMLALFAGGTGRLLAPALVVGLVAHAENAAITMVLPSWRHDVHSLRAAWRIRRDAGPRTPDR